MSKVEKLIERLCRKPTPAGFKFSDLRRIMRHFGYIESNKGITSGSRVGFYNPHTKATLLLHKPHPGDEMVKAAVDTTVDFLRRQGHI